MIFASHGHIIHRVKNLLIDLDSNGVRGVRSSTAKVADRSIESDVRRRLMRKLKIEHLGRGSGPWSPMPIRVRYDARKVGITLKLLDQVHSIEISANYNNCRSDY